MFYFSTKSQELTPLTMKRKNGTCSMRVFKATFAFLKSGWDRDLRSSAQVEKVLFGRYLIVSLTREGAFGSTKEKARIYVHFTLHSPMFLPALQKCTP